MRILLCQIPHIHLGYLGCFGNDWIPTINLDRLAAEGVIFDQHYSDGGNLDRAILSGRYDFHHDASDLDSLLAPWTDQGVQITRTDITDTSTLYEDSAAWTDMTHPLHAEGPALVWLRFPSLAPPWNIPEPFLASLFAPVDPDEEAEAQSDAEDEEEEFDEHQEEEDDEEEQDVGVGDVESEPLLPLLDPPDHEPPDADAMFGEQIRMTYAAKMTEIDEVIGSLRTSLEDQGVLDDVLWIIVGDNGLSLGEHGPIGKHPHWPHEEHIHQLLLIRVPNAEHRGRRILALTQAVDLCPTIGEWLSLPEPPSHGHNLWPLIRGEQSALREYTVTGQHEPKAWALRCPEWALLVRTDDEAEPEVRLYNKPDDRWEVSDVQQLYQDWCDRLKDTLFQFVDGTQSGPDFPHPPLPDMDGDESEHEAEPSE